MWIMPRYVSTNGMPKKDHILPMQFVPKNLMVENYECTAIC